MADDNAIKIGVETDISSLRSGMAEAQSVIASSTANMEAAYKQVASATIVYDSAQKTLHSTIKLLSKSESERATAMAAMPSVVKANTEASRALAEAKKALAAANQSAAVTEKNEEQAVVRGVSAHKAAAAAMRELEGNFTRNTRAADQFLISSLKLGPVLQAAFPIIGAAAFAGILVDVGKKMYDAFDLGGERARKTAEDIEANSISMRHMNDSLVVELDKLQMADAKLEHKPITNGMKLAIDEAAEAADTLYEKLGGDLRRIEETVKGMQGTALQQAFGVKGGTGYEQTMVSEHTRHLAEAADMAAQLRESERYNRSLMERKNQLQAIQSLGTGATVQSVGGPTTISYTGYDQEGKAIQKTMSLQEAKHISSLANVQTELDATQHLITMQGQEQRAIQATIALEAEQGKHNTLEAGLEGQRNATKAAEAALKSIETEYESLNAKEASFTGHGLTAGEALSFWAPYLTTFKAKSEEAKHVMAEYVKAQEEMHRQLEAIKSSMKKSDSEDVKMAEVSPEINKWIVAQADDVLRTGEAWKEYHDAIDKSLELEAQAKEQIQLANVHAMEAAGSISKLAAAQETAAIHAADYKAKIQALREELERLQKEEKDYEAQNAGLHNPKNLAQQQQVQNQITQVKGQADTSAVQDNAAITKQIEAPYIKAFDDINTAFVGFINEWMTTNKGFVRSMEDASRQMAVSMIDDIAKIELKKVEMWALNKLLGDQDDGTDEAQKRITSNSEVAESDAGVAAANAALMASPGGVWDAIAAGSIMYAAMTPWVAAASLDTGTGYVPRDGVAAIHQGEIIVPAPTADELRNGSGGRDITITQHNNITAANEKAIIAAIDRNPHAIAGALRRHLRQGGH